jgi:hypothetical protein
VNYIADLAITADMMEVFSELPRDLNFIDHTSDIGWKAYAFSSRLVWLDGSRLLPCILTDRREFWAGSRGRCR